MLHVRTTKCLVVLFIAATLFVTFNLLLAAPQSQQALAANLVSPSAGPNAPQESHYLFLPLVTRNYDFPYCTPQEPMWASNADGVLLRWFWHPRCAQDAEFRIVRAVDGGPPEIIADQLAPVTDLEEAEALLGPGWDWDTYAETLGVGTLGELLALPGSNLMQARHLANQVPGVAKVYAWGYADTTAPPGHVYTYRVMAVRPADGRSVQLGEIVVAPEDPTPLPAPIGLVATQVISDDLVGALDWAEAQKNRKADRDVYLRWNATTTETAAIVAPGITPPSQVGYDIYRAQSELGPYTRINEDPVAPMAAQPAPDDPEPETYELHDYYFADEDPGLVYGDTYYYRVAPRDLLGEPLDWSKPAHRARFSAAITAEPRDTAPPPVPRDLTAVAQHLAGTIVLTWTPQLTDTVGYRLIWSRSPSASLIIENPTDPERHWMPLAEIADPHADSFTHTGGVPLEEDTPYWYRIRAVDAYDNLSAPSEPVYAALHDRIPPDAPGIIYDDRGIIVSVPDDATEINIYCAVDGGPFQLWRVLTPDNGGSIVYDIGDDYTPPLRSEFTCNAQALDANGNRSDFSYDVDFELGPYPSAAPPAPIITGIHTLAGGNYDWTAALAWSATPAPGVTGFRIYRQRYGSDDTPVLILDENDVGAEDRVAYDRTVEPGLIYSYTVATYRPPGLYGSTAVTTPSNFRLYKVIPPLDCCNRPLGTIAWREPTTYTPGIGANLLWESDDFGRFIVFRSPAASSGFTQLTPPLTGGQHVDADAEHNRYVYVVVQLDWATGELIAVSPPWSASGATTQAVGQIASDADPDAIARLLGPAIQQAQDGALSEARARAAVQPLDTDAAETLTLSASDDAYIDTAHPDDNYGSDPQMHVGRNKFGTQTALVAFDLGDLPNGAIINQAQLAVYLESSSGLKSVAVDAAQISSSWSEGSVTARTPPLAGPVQDTQTVGDTSGWIRWTVTALVQSWWDGSTDNHGLSLQGPSSGDAYDRVFTTKEAPRRHPALEIIYTMPPAVLFFGDGFTIDVAEYENGSTLDCLTGHGTMVLGGDPLPTYRYDVPFTCVAAGEDGVVTKGTADVPLDSPIEVAYPGGLDYEIGAIQVTEIRGGAQISLTLPTDIVAHVGGQPFDPFPWPVELHPDLTFDQTLDAGSLSNQNCAVATPTFYFEMGSLPLRIVPISTVTFNELAVTFPGGCTQYDERFAGTRPTPPEADAGDGYLRPAYQSTAPIAIGATGLSGAFATDAAIDYVSATPYGFHVAASGGVFDLSASHIVAGHLGHGTLTFRYYQQLLTEPLTVPPPYPTGVHEGRFDSLAMGQDGSLTGAVTAMATVPPQQIQWAGGAFSLRDQTYALYLPPIQTSKEPWVALWGDHPDDPTLQPGLNHVTAPGESADFSWRNCGEQDPITFPDGVSTDLYVRRGGISDYVTATIPLKEGIATNFYGYTAELTSFRIVFCDNFIHNSDVAANVMLPYPVDATVPLVNMTIDADDGCVEGGCVSDEGDPLPLSYWQVDLHPDAVEFREDPDLPPPDQPEHTRKLWFLGTMDVPHLGPPPEEGGAAVGQGEAPIPIEISFAPKGTFYASNLVYQQAHYAFDGFDAMIEAVDLSSYETHEQPSWVTEATLGDAPCASGTCTQGFVKLDGLLLAPLFGGIKRYDTVPQLHLMGDSDYVGFTVQPRVQRGWTSKAGLGFVFDLLYAHSVHTHTARFLAWDQETFLNAEAFGFDAAEEYLQLFQMDWATIISPTETGVYFGLSTAPALIRSLAEMTISPTVPSTFTTEISQTAKSTWFPALGISETLGVTGTQGYLDLTGAIWENALFTRPERVSQALDDYITHTMEITNPLGGGTMGKLKDWGVTFSEIRGQADFSSIRNDDGDLVDWHLEELHVSLQFTITWGAGSSTTSTQLMAGPQALATQPSRAAPGCACATPARSTSAAQLIALNPDRPLQVAGYTPAQPRIVPAGLDDETPDPDQAASGDYIRAKRLTFRITRDGEYVLVGNRVRTTLTEKVKDIDFALLLQVKHDPRLEGGLVLYEFTIQGVKFDRVGAVFGVGELGNEDYGYPGDPFFYLGALGDAKFGPTGDEYKLGGAVLIGTIYTQSIVLREMGFADALDTLHTEGEDVLIGGYAHVYGDFPIYESGCYYNLTAGGEVKVWYFAQRREGDQAWGGRVRAYVHGKVLCIINGRGDLTLEIRNSSYTTATHDYAFTGHFWVAAGVGWCSPGSWKSWESKWWDDSWCYCCGAMVQCDYNVSVVDDWKWTTDTACE